MNTIEQHFKNKPEKIQLIYNQLLTELNKFGTVKESPNNSSIHLLNKYGFAGVYARKNYILLHIHLARELDNERIIKIEQISKNRFKHVVKIQDEKEIDQEILDWLKEAYELKGAKKINN